MGAGRARGDRGEPRAHIPGSPLICGSSFCSSCPAIAARRGTLPSPRLASCTRLPAQHGRGRAPASLRFAPGSLRFGSARFGSVRSSRRSRGARAAPAAAAASPPLPALASHCRSPATSSCRIRGPARNFGPGSPGSSGSTVERENAEARRAVGGSVPATASLGAAEAPAEGIGVVGMQLRPPRGARSIASGCLSILQRVSEQQEEFQHPA